MTRPSLCRSARPEPGARARARAGGDADGDAAAADSRAPAGSWAPKLAQKRTAQIGYVLYRSVRLPYSLLLGLFISQLVKIEL
jgi:hypothetical protein